jgi:RNA polymerase sigma factor (sigma-70 family)
MPHVNEHMLIAKCIAGHRVYQEALYQKYRRKFMGICLRYSKNREEAEDMLQEGFYKIFKSLQQYKAAGSFEGWMRKIMVNTILEEVRKKNLMFSEADISNLPDEPYNDDLWNDMNAKELVALINLLPPGYRVVFNLFAVEGYSHREIGERLGISEGTSRSQFSKARKQLQQMILKRETNYLSNAR